MKTVRYNRFIDSLEEEAWIIFCHEDWQLRQDIRPLLEQADRHTLWGPVGAYMEVCPHADFIHLCGTIRQTKHGRWAKTVRGTWKDNSVHTFDCQCLIVHSSLLREKGLRFDERLSFDLYAEDFCAAAFLAGVPSRILPLACTHHSGGTLTQRYWDGLQYLRDKYKDVPLRFPSIVGRRNSFGGDQSKPIYNYRRQVPARIRYRLKK